MVVITITRTNPSRDVGGYREELSLGKLLFSRRQRATLGLGFKISAK